MSKTRLTEERRENYIQAAIDDIEGETDAEYLMERQREIPHQLELEQPTVNAYWKVERLSLSSKGRQRLATVETWRDVETI